jgi:hypothetical protein
VVVLLLLLVVFVSTAPLLVISVVQQWPFLYRIESVAKKHTTIVIIHQYPFLKLRPLMNK